MQRLKIVAPFIDNRGSRRGWSSCNGGGMFESDGLGHRSKGSEKGIGSEQRATAVGDTTAPHLSESKFRTQSSSLNMTSAPCHGLIEKRKGAFR